MPPERLPRSGYSTSTSALWLSPCRGSRSPPPPGIPQSGLPRKGDPSAAFRLSSVVSLKRGCPGADATSARTLSSSAREESRSNSRGDQRRTAAFEAPGIRRACDVAAARGARRARGGCVLPRGRTPRRPRGTHTRPLPRRRTGRGARRAARARSDRHGDRPHRRRPPGGRGAATGARRAVRSYRGRHPLDAPRRRRVACDAVRLRGDHARHRRSGALPHRRPPCRAQDVGLAPRDALDTSAAAGRRRRLRRPGHPSRRRPDDRPGSDLRFRGRRRHAGRSPLAARQGEDPRVGLEG